MVGVSAPLELEYRARETTHFGLARPIEIGQIMVLLKLVFAFKFWHFAAVDPKHKFPPAQNLPNKTLDALEWNIT